MLIRATLILLAAIFYSACDEQPSIKVGDVYTTGPSFSPDGTPLANEILFHYEASDAEPVHFVVDGEIVKTVTIEGEVNWRIRIEDQKVTVSGATMIFEIPVVRDGLLDSDVTVNGSKQMGFDISVDGVVMLKIECPSKVVSLPQITKDKKQNKSEMATPRKPSDQF